MSQTAFLSSEAFLSDPVQFKHRSKIGFILTTYSRIDDLLVHLEILKYFPIPYEVIPIWMNQDVPDYFLSEMKKYPHAHYCNGINFSLGALLGLVDGLKKAKEIGLDYVIYRNSDDWIFNHNFVLENIKNTKDISAYNWFGQNTNKEFALNEMCLNVDLFAKSIDWAEDYFLNSNDNLLCEFKIAKWIRKVTKDIYHLPDREHPKGIGMVKKCEENNRFFNKKWKLLGFHDNLERLNCYKTLDFAYRKELEQENHFKRWLLGGKWNLEVGFNGRERRNCSVKPLKLIVPDRRFDRRISPKDE